MNPEELQKQLDAAREEEDKSMPWARRTAALLLSRLLAKEKTTHWMMDEVEELEFTNQVAISRAWKELYEEMKERSKGESDERMD